MKNFCVSVSLLLLTLSLRAEVPAGYHLETVNLPPGVVTAIGICHKNEKTTTICSWEGEVWEYTDGVWTLFAEGLMDPLGIHYDRDEDAYYVAQKPELTRLRDTDGDGVADTYETHVDRFGYAGGYHEFHYGPVVDSLKRKYGVLNLGASTGPDVRGEHRDAPNWSYMKYSAPWRGWVYRSDRAGHFHPFACGFRSPAGIGISPDDELFITDNQGDWMPVCALFHVREGGFYGHPSSLGGHPDFGPDSLENLRAGDFQGIRRPPAIWFPYNKISRSPGSPVWDTTGGKFGPFENQIFIGDQSLSTIFRCGLEWIAGDYQGWCVNFAGRTNSGPVNMSFDAQGRLWIPQVGRGWNSQGGERTALQTLRWDGASTPFEIHTVNLTQKGFRVTFTQPLAEQDLAASLPQLSSWHYHYWSKYGSDEVDKKPHPVTSHVLSANRKTLEIEAPLAAKKVFELTFNELKAQDGSALVNRSAFYTINRLKPAAEQAKGPPPMIPGSSWRRNDNARPLPPVVAPLAEEKCSVPVPENATVLDQSQWTNPNWKFDEDGVFPRSQGNNTTKLAHGTSRIHLEFRLDPSDDPAWRGQLYGNSGIFLMSGYELQVMNSHQNETCADGMCGAFWGQIPPRVNASRPPGQWQSYDILMKAPEFADDGAVTEPLRATVYQNGILIHDDVSLFGEVNKPYSRHGKRPLLIQDHKGTGVSFRNAWIVPDIDYETALPTFWKLFDQPRELAQ